MLTLFILYVNNVKNNVYIIQNIVRKFNRQTFRAP